MSINTIQDIAVEIKRKFNDESKLCFGAAAGCFVIGAVGWLVNLVQPETTLLHGLLVVAGFYGFLGVVSLFKPSTSTADAMDEMRGTESNHSIGLCADKQLESAA